MTVLFWSISQEARIALANYQWEHFKSQLDEIAPPQEPAHDKALEPEPDPALVHEMQMPPKSPRRVV
ncbi:hypothetical protein LCGC14_1968590 [marine sediment metagenome]|uniref:Uncharacterized protein n=1 Tax=marine sediment metagenome TaxID=412755 RepID=A0A0F9FCF3_9ZZZZ